jgi:hypothetical protein
MILVRSEIAEVDVLLGMMLESADRITFDFYLSMFSWLIAACLAG